MKNRWHCAVFSLLAFFAASLTGCGNHDTPIDLTDPSEEEKTDVETARQVLEKILYLQDLEDKTSIDEFGFYLPRKENTFVDHGDAFYHQAYHIVALCQQTEAHHQNLEIEGEAIFSDPRNNKTEQIKGAWNAVRLAQEADGRIFRHPRNEYRFGTTNSGSISHDLLAALYYLAAEVKYRDCKPAVDEMGDYLYRFAVYANGHAGELGVGNTSPSTQLRDWLPLHHLLLLYGKDSPINNHWILLSETTHTLPTGIKTASTEWNMKFDCEFRESNNSLCEGLSTTAIHLRWLLATMFTIETYMQPEKARYSRSDVRGFLKKLATLGNDRSVDGKKTLVLPTWAAFRNHTGQSVNRVLQELNSWPHHKLPTKEPEMSLGIWGCIEYVWNNLPKENCNEQTDHVYTALSWEVPFFTALARPIRIP